MSSSRGVLDQGRWIKDRGEGCIHTIILGALQRRARLPCLDKRERLENEVVSVCETEISYLMVPLMILGSSEQMFRSTHESFLT